MNAQIPPITEPELQLLTQAELKVLDIPLRNPLLGDWMMERQPSMIYGQTGRGKSLFGMSVAIAVAGGGEVFGWSAPAARLVLYIDAEMDIADVKSRDVLLSGAVSGIDEAATGKNLTILSRHHQDHGTVFPDLVESKGQESLLAIVKQLRPALVVLDNLSTLADISDENDAAAVNPVLETLWKLRKLDCAVLLVHHTGKQEGKYRGTSKLAAPMEIILQLAPNNDLLNGDAGFMLLVDKCRSGHEPDSIRVELVVDSQTGLGRWVHGNAQERKLQELVEAVKTCEYGRSKDIAVALDISEGELSKRKKKVLRLGLMEAEEWDRCLLEGQDDF